MSNVVSINDYQQNLQFEKEKDAAVEHTRDVVIPDLLAAIRGDDRLHAWLTRVMTALLKGYIEHAPGCLFTLEIVGRPTAFTVHMRAGAQTSKPFIRVLGEANVVKALPDIPYQDAPPDWVNDQHQAYGWHKAKRLLFPVGHVYRMFIDTGWLCVDRQVREEQMELRQTFQRDDKRITLVFCHAVLEHLHTLFHSEDVE